MSTPALVEARDLVKRFGDFVAVDGIDFDVLPGASAASGLPVYRTGAGMRDVRATLVVVQSFSRSWHVGAGLLYSHLLSGAADSPVVQRGSSEQLIGGVGVAYAW